MPTKIKARSELVLDQRFARVATVDQALAGPAAKKSRMSTAGRRTIAVYVVLAPHTLLLDVAGPLEVLRKANDYQRRHQVSRPGLSGQWPK